MCGWCAALAERRQGCGGEIWPVGGGIGKNCGFGHSCGLTEGRVGAKPLVKVE